MSDKRNNSHSKKKHGQNPHKRNNPRRGLPGVLLTCERGREKKCKREGLDILRYYLNKNDAPVKDQKELTLEEEIAMLQKGASSDQVLGDNGSLETDGKNAFSVSETGCGGTVFIICTLPDAALIPPIQTEWSEANDAKRKAEEHVEDNGERKRARVEPKDVESAKKDEPACENDKRPLTSETVLKETAPWDPVETVQQVLKDLDSASTSAPSSRFVTRMIPIQATCFASVEEIGLTAKALVDKYLKDEMPSTFAVNIKRRNCSSATRDEIINAVAGAVLDLESHNGAWKVDLKSPEFTIMVEVAKTLCGISIVRDVSSYRNFNLLEIREAQQQKDKATS